MLNTIFREIVALSVPGDSDSRSAGIATVVLFVVVAVMFGIASIVNLFYLCCKYNDDVLCFKTILLIVEIVGAVLYFYGDNITYIFDQYGDNLGCRQQCMDGIRITAVITLGLALMFYQLFPSCLRKVAKLSEIDLPKTTGWYSASDLMTTMLKVDALFTVVAVMAQTTDFCGTIDLSISIAFLIISVVVGIVLMFFYGLFSYKSIDDKQFKFIVPVAFILVLIAFPMYILADNLQPLDCAFGCDSFASNLTQNDLGCNEVANSALRLCFTLAAFLIVFMLSIILFCCRNNTGGEKAI